MSTRTKCVAAGFLALAFVAVIVAWLMRGEGDVAQATASAASVETNKPSESAALANTLGAAEIPQRSTSTPKQEPDAVSELPVAATAPTAPVLCTVLGFVVAPKRKELDLNVRLLFVDHLGRREHSVAGADGAYSITGLAPGTWWVSCHATCGSVQERIELDAREPERRLDLRLVQPAEVRVRVTSTTGEPIVVATCAVATLEAPGEWFETFGDGVNISLGVGRFVQSNSYGVAQSGGYIGRVVLEVEPPVFVSLLRRERVLATQRIGRLGDDAEFVIDPKSPLLDKCTVLGRAVDAAKREPVAGALVMIGASFCRKDPNAPGEFSMSGLWPGRYDVVIYKAGLGISHTSVLLAPGATLDLGDVELQPESWINGRTVDEHGQGVYARLRIEPIDDKPVPGRRASFNDEATSNSDGTFHIGGLMRGKYLLKVVNTESLSWALMVQLVDTNIGPVEGLRIEVSVGVSLVVRAASDDWVGIRWVVRNSDGLRVLSTRMSSIAPQAFQFAPGAYTVEVEMPDGKEPRVHKLELKDEPVELVLP